MISINELLWRWYRRTDIYEFLTLIIPIITFKQHSDILLGLVQNYTFDYNQLYHL